MATLVVMSAVALLMTACGSDEKTPATLESVTGQVGEIEPASLLEVGALTVTDQAGRTWRFEGRSYKGFTPSHLREHKLQGLPITVLFHREGSVLVIDDVTD